MKIDIVTARAIPDTRGRLTIETTLAARGSTSLNATASVPSGKSTGEHEAAELDAAVAVENVTGEIAASLGSRDFSSPDELDAFLIELDGTPNKSRLGANAILSVSIAAQRLFALQKGVPLWKSIAERASGGEHFFGSVPSAATPGHAFRHDRVERNALEKTFLTTSPPSAPPHLFVNVMNGGVHAGFKLPFQEYMLVVGGKTSDAFPIAREAFAKLGEVLGDVGMGDEGGYAPTFDTLEKPFEILAELVKEFPGTSIAVDAAASQLFQDGAYHLLGRAYTTNELAETYANLVGHFGVKSIEDPFDERATGDFARLTAAVKNRILVVGDDFTCSNPKLIFGAVKNKAVNAVVIKPNQIGTVMEAIESVKIAQSAGLKVIASHRSGETDDTFIADFSYGIGAYGIKAGGFGQPERLEKYNRLLAIEREAEAV